MSNKPQHPVLPDDWHVRNDMERRNYLSANADKVRKSDNVRRPLSDDENETLRFKLQKLSIDLRDLQEEYDEVKKGYREEINDLKERLDDIVSALEKGFEKVKGDVFELRDYENEQVYEFMGDGTEINSRKMLPNERQQTVQSGMRKVENDG